MWPFGRRRRSPAAAAAASPAALKLPPFLFPSTSYRLRLLAGLIVARYAFNAALRGPTARLAARRGDSPGHRDGTRLLEEIWVTAGNLVILGAALFVMLRRWAR